MKIESKKDLAEYAVREARANGASYAEARIHGESSSGFILKNGEPQPSILGESLGIGIRILAKGALGFSATNNLDRSAVKAVTLRAIKIAKSSASMLRRPIVFDDAKPVRAKVRAEEKQKIEDASSCWLRSLLRDVESEVKEEETRVKIPNRIFTASASVEEKYFFSSDGARVESRVPRIHFSGVLTAIDRGEIAQRIIQQGESGGLEVVKRIGLLEKLKKEAETLGRVLREAKKPPSGKVEILLSPELSGIAAHESVGHPQEADRVLGREGAQAGESYLKADSIGRRIGSEQANVSDDPTLDYSNGFSPVDDEGVEGKKRRLIEDGVIAEFLHNRSSAADLHSSSNGASRSVSFDREPIIRMSNTFVEPGDYSFQEILKEIHRGVYIKSFTEWNIDDKRLNQRYVGLEAYSVEKGELGGLVKAPVLEITTPKLWSSVKGRTKTLEFEAATCGKGDPMQGIPVWTGGPDTLLSGIVLGAR